MIRDDKMKAIEEKMKLLGIKEDDLIEKFISGSGPGGQKINKTQNCVYLKHIPSGLEVKCARDRSREANRFFARRLLVEKLKKQLYQIKTKKEAEEAKIRRQKKRRSRRAKEKCLEEKKRHSEVKQARRPPEPS